VPFVIASLVDIVGGGSGTADTDATTGTMLAEAEALGAMSEAFACFARRFPFPATGDEPAPAITTAKRTAIALAAVAMSLWRMSFCTDASTRGDTATFLQVAWHTETMNPRPLPPRTALITGASAGIGRALAERLASRGTTVALVARRAEVLDEVRRAIESAGGRAICVTVDAADPERVVETIERVDRDLHGLDMVVANAGIGGTVPGKEMTWQRVAPVLQLNVMGAIATICAALPAMVARGRGHVVGVSSLAGIRGLPKTAPYSASKAALSTFLESLAIDLEGSGVFVTDVRPGYVKTDLTAGRSYKMPMLMELNDAIDVIVDGVDRGDSVVAFPKPLASALAATRLLPVRAYGMLARKVIAR